MLAPMDKKLLEVKYTKSIKKDNEFLECRHVLEGKAEELRAAGMGKKLNRSKSLTKDKIDDFLFSKHDHGTELIYFVQGPTKNRGHGLIAKHHTTILEMFSTDDEAKCPIMPTFLPTLHTGHRISPMQAPSTFLPLKSQL